jgi:HEAT repeat protein
MGLFGPNINRMLKKGDLKGLVALLGHKDIKVRVKAARALGKLGNPAAIHPLIERKNVLDVSYKKAVSEALDRLTVPGSLNTFVHLLSDDLYGVWQSAESYLAKLVPQVPPEQMNTLLDDRSIDILIYNLTRSSPIYVEILIKAQERSLTKLADLLDGSSQPMKVGLDKPVEILGKMKSPAALQPLLDQIGNPKVIQSGLAIALESLGSQAEAPLRTRLSEMVNSSDPDLQIRACSFLAEKSTDETVDLLKGLLWSENDKVQKAAFNAMGKVGERGNAQALNLLINALRSQNLSSRQAAAASLGRIKHPMAVVPLIEALGDADSTVFESVLKGVELNADPRAVPVLLDAAYQRNPALVLRVLSSIGDDRVVDALVPTLDDPNAVNRKEIIDTLSSLYRNKRLSTLAQQSLLSRKGAFETHSDYWYASSSNDCPPDDTHHDETKTSL